MSKFILTQDKDILLDGEEKLRNRIINKKWKEHDQKNSLAAIDKFRDMNLPTMMTENELKRVKTTHKYLHIFGVDIKISPNAIYTAEINGKTHVGACKVHISKGKPFSVKQSKLVATLIYQFISDFVAEEAWYVDPNMCICVDPFAGTTIAANAQVGFHMSEVKELCKELPGIWDQAKITLDSKVA